MPWLNTSSEDEEGTDEDKSSLDQSSYVSSEPQDNDANSSQPVSLTSSVSSLPAQQNSETGLNVDDVKLTVASGDIIELEEENEGEQVVPQRVEMKKNVQRPRGRILRPQLSLVSISTLEEPRQAKITGVAHSVYPETCLSPTIIRQDTIQRISTSRSSPLLRRNSEDERQLADSEMMSLVTQSMKQISDMEQQLKEMTDQLKNISIENERLRRQLASERLENESLREEARHAASELRQFTEWFYQQQFRTLTQDNF
jgi:regulator of replication initiation timing